MDSALLLYRWQARATSGGYGMALCALSVIRYVFGRQNAGKKSNNRLHAAALESKILLIEII
jgi:hypothetical protein